VCLCGFVAESGSVTKEMRTKTRLIAVYWLSQLGKGALDSCARDPPKNILGSGVPANISLGKGTGGGWAQNEIEHMGDEGGLELPPGFARTVSVIEEKAASREGSLLEEEKQLLEKLMKRKGNLSDHARQVLSTRAHELCYILALQQIRSTNHVYWHLNKSCPLRTI